MSVSEQPIVTRLGQVGVFLPPRWADENGKGVVRLVLAIERIKELEKVAGLTNPKFAKALNDDPELMRQVRDAISAFCGNVQGVGVVSIKSE